MIKLEQVKKVYRGKAHQCCCGCCGTHRTVEENASYVKKIVKKINEAIAKGYDVDRDTSYVAFQDDTTIYIAYFE